jgi:hypothetical protein
MDDSVFAGPSASGYDALGTEDTEQSVARRVSSSTQLLIWCSDPPLLQLPTPGRRPGGPRQAFRIPSTAQDVRNGFSFDVAHSTDMGMITSNPNATTMDIDLSCLDALDDQLLASPIDSFMDVCWADAVGEYDLDLSGDSPTLYNAPISNPQNGYDDIGHDDYYDLHPLDSDNEPWDQKENVSVKTYIKYVCIDIQSRS